MPIVGTLSVSVIIFDNFVSTHSSTTEKIPAFSKSLAYFKILFLSVNFFPLKENFFSV